MVRTLYISERCISENRGLGPNGAQIDPGPAGRRGKGLLENPNLLLQVVDPPCHPLVDRVRDHRDDELKRRREHRIGPRLPAPRRLFKAAVCRGIVRESAAMGFWTALGG